MPLQLSQFTGVDREAIWVALFEHLQAKLAGHFQTIGRRHVQPPQLPLDAQPALFCVQVREPRGGGSRGLPNTLTLKGYLIIYCVAPATQESPGEETVLAATTLNTLFKAIDDALVPDNVITGHFTLGGIVQGCWIEGHVDQDPGIFTNQAAAIIPISILVP